MSSSASVVIDGSGQGAVRAIEAPGKAFKGLANAAKQATSEIAAGARAATRAQKEFEAEVTKAEQKLRRQEQTARATASAMRRLGREAGPNAGQGPGGGPRPAGQQAAQQALTAAGRMGGQAGHAFSGLGSALGQISPALAGVGIAAVGLRLAFGALAASSERAAQAARREAEIRQQVQDAVKRGQESLAGSLVGAERAGGQDLRAAISAGSGGIGDIRQLANRLGTDAQTATQVAEALRGLPGELRTQLEQAFRGAERLGGSGLTAVREGRGLIEDGRFLPTRQGGDLQASLVREGLSPARSAQMTDAQILAALRNQDLNRLEAIRDMGSREGRTRFGQLGDSDGLKALDRVTAEASLNAQEPVRAEVARVYDAVQRQVTVLEAMAAAQGPAMAAMVDLRDYFRGGEGSYATQARAVGDGIRR